MPVALHRIHFNKKSDSCYWNGLNLIPQVCQIILVKINGVNAVYLFFVMDGQDSLTLSSVIVPAVSSKVTTCHGIKYYTLLLLFVVIVIFIVIVSVIINSATFCVSLCVRRFPDMEARVYRRFLYNSQASYFLLQGYRESHSQ